MVSLNHTGLFVKALSNSIQFYTDFLGFNLKTRLENKGAYIAVIEIDGNQIELLQRKDKSKTFSTGQWGHIAFYVPNYDEKVDQIKSQGWEHRQLTMDDGTRLCFFPDPDGHTLEIMSKGL